MPHPLATTKDLASIPWWAVVGGLVGAVQLYAGLKFVNKIGAGPFVGITVTAALISSLVIDHFGWFRMDTYPENFRRLSACLRSNSHREVLNDDVPPQHQREKGVRRV